MISVSRLLTVSAQISLAIILLFPILRIRLPNNEDPVSRHTGVSPKVHIWETPKNCQKATFASAPAKNSPSSFPYFILRDLTLDNRPAANHALGTHDPPGTRRLILYLTVHLSTRLSLDKNGLQITTATSHPALTITPEYVLEVCPALVPKVPNRYRPGLRTRFGHEGVEWQLGIRVSPTNPAHPDISQAVRDGAVANVTIPAHRYDGVSLPYELSFPLRCALGWGQLPAFLPGAHRDAPACDAGGVGASGAVLLSGSALYGKKKREARYFKEVAHFAARGLRGTVRFQAVVMSVVSEYPASEIALRCGGDAECVGELERRNMELLQAIGRVVEEEFRLLGVEEELLGRVAIVATCRLGSDAGRSERDEPCGVSKHAGQYVATYMSYGMVAPYFKWAASYDMDEYFSKVPKNDRSRVKTVSAVELLDEADRKVGGKLGDLMFPWLRFRVRDQNVSFALSRELLDGKYAVLGHEERNYSMNICYEKSRMYLGKSAVRCDVGLGFTIHRPIVGSVPDGIFQKQGARVYRGVRTWHARLGSSSGKCEFLGS